ELGESPPEPSLELGARRVQDPFADRDDEARLLRDRNELTRKEETARRVDPAQEGLAAGDRSPLERHERLVVEHELGAFQRVSEILLQGEQLERAGVHLVI